MNPQTVWYSWQKKPGKQEESCLHPTASRICNPCAAASAAGRERGAVAFDIKCTKSRAPACTSLDKQALFASNLISQTGCHIETGAPTLAG